MEKPSKLISIFREEIDAKCEQILTVMVLQKAYQSDSVRFNELYRSLKNIAKSKMSKPTFHEHLKHLVKKKIVKRQRKGKQEVRFYLNIENPKVFNLKEMDDSLREEHERLSRVMKNPNFWLTLPDFISYYFAVCELRKMKLIIKYALSPEKAKENVLALVLQARFQEALENQLLSQTLSIIDLETDSAKKEEMKTKIIEAIEYAISECKKELLSLPKEE
jgi:DNA-binding transcriptional ArsR family regulator